ncbi:MAG: phosphotransferase [Anaerolineae bacterium]
MGPAWGDEPEKGLARVAMKQELVRVLDYYTLGRLRDARRAERGFVNDNWIVETTRGRYFLKRRHPRLRQPEFIRGQHELIGCLRQAGFPAPTIVPTASGETFLALDGEVYEIYVYVEHEPYDHERPAHLKEAALTLGRCHTILHGFAPETLRPLGELYGPYILSTILTNLGQAWQLDQDPELAGIAHQLEAEAADLASRFAEHGALPYLVIHGDYYADNLLFKGDRIVCVVDYDKASWQPRVVELAEALIYFASPRPGHLKHLVYPGFLDWALFTHFLQNYVRAVIPGSDEVRALPDYIQCIWVSVSLKRLLENDHRPAEALEALQEVLALSAWANANADNVIEASHSAIGGSQAATE